MSISVVVVYSGGTVVSEGVVEYFGRLVVSSVPVVPTVVVPYDVAVVTSVVVPADVTVVTDEVVEFDVVVLPVVVPNVTTEVMGVVTDVTVVVVVVVVVVVGVVSDFFLFTHTGNVEENEVLPFTLYVTSPLSLTLAT